MEKTLTIYEYAIVKDKIVQYTVNAKQQTGKLYKGKTGTNTRFFELEKLEIVNKGRVASLEDNFPKYKEILLKDYEERIEVARKRLANQEEILKKIREQ